MVMEQWFSPSKAVLVFILATFTGGLSSTAVANLPAGAVIRATPGIVYINITGNVIAPPPCLINDGKMIEVNFGEVMSTRINDSNYTPPETQAPTGIHCLCHAPECRCGNIP